MAVDVSKIPNNSKFDPVRVAILNLQGQIEDTGATIGNGTLTINTSGALTGSGTFTANQTGPTTISIGIDGAEYLNNVTHDTVNQKLVFTRGDATTFDINLSQYIDDTNLARLVSGSVNSTTGIATFTRDDATTFTVDFSGFLEDDTLDSVTTRNNATTNTISVGGIDVPYVDADSKIRLESGSFTDSNDRYEILATGDVMFFQYWDNDQGNGTSLQKPILGLEWGGAANNEVTVFGDLRFKSGNVASPTVDSVIIDMDVVNGEVNLTNLNDGTFAGDLTADTITATTTLTVGTTDVYNALPTGIGFETVDNRLKFKINTNGGFLTANAIDDIVLSESMAANYIPYVSSAGGNGDTFNAVLDDSFLKINGSTLELDWVIDGSPGVYTAHDIKMRSDGGGFGKYYEATYAASYLQFLHYNSSSDIDTAKIGGTTTGRIRINDTYSLPVGDGTSGQVLTTDGTGDLSWADASGGGGTADYLRSFDTRSVASTPETQDASSGIRFDFKSNSTNGLSDGGTYNGVMYWRKYGGGSDWTGGGAKEIAYTDNGNLWHRYGTGTSWGDWRKVWDSTNDGYGSGLDADLLDGRHLDGAGGIGERLFNNQGRNHSTYTDFNDTSLRSGVNFLQGGTNGPTGTSTDQWYGFRIGLGADYGTITGASQDYASEFYWGRQSQGSNPYLWARDLENGTWGSWRKMYAGYADNAGSSSTLTINANDSFSGTYSLLWHSGSTVYSSSFMTINGATDTLNVPNFYVVGDIGIGTNSQNGRFEIKGNGNQWGEAPAVRLWDSTNSKGWLVGSAYNYNPGDFYIRQYVGETGNPTSSNEEFIIKSSTGYIGINESQPAHRLDVDGTVRVQDYNSLTLNGVELKGYPNNQLWFISNNSGEAQFIVGTSWDWDRQVEFRYNPATIGTPDGTLSIGQLQKNSGTWTHGNTTFYTNGEARMQIDSAGNVGIGQSPTKRLTVKTNTTVGQGGTIRINRGADRATHQAYFVIESDSYSDEVYLGVGANSGNATLGAVHGNLSFTTGSYTERMRIDYDGTITINSSLQGSTKFRVYYDMSVYNTVNLTNSSWGREGFIASYGGNGVRLGNDTGSVVWDFNGSNGYLYLPKWLKLGTNGEGIFSDTNGAHFYPNTYSSYGTWRINGTRGGYGGLLVRDVANKPHVMFGSSGNGGFYIEGNGVWPIYYHVGNNSVGIGGSATQSGYAAYVNGNARSTGAMVANGGFTSAKTNWYAEIGSASFTWAGQSTQYPTIYSSASDRWVMICFPHIPYLRNGVNGHTGNTTGSTIVFASDASTTTYWGIGVNPNNTGNDDQFTISRATTRLFYIGSSGQVYCNDWYRINGSGGVYWETYGRGIRESQASGSSYGNITTYNSGHSGWDGFTLGRSNMSFMGTNSNCGIYAADLGVWGFYYTESTNGVGLMTSTTSSTYEVYVGGDLYATGDIVAYSDRRVKENIINIDSALNKVKALQGVYYNRINDADKVREIGFIAQDVHEAVPELASYAEDIDEWGVKYSQVTGLHNEAIKELASQLEEKDEQIANLQSQIDELKQLILNK